MIRSLATLAKSKLAIAATATLATGGGVRAKAAVTGNPNPFNWGHQVKSKVVTCKQDLRPGSMGSGVHERFRQASRGAGAAAALTGRVSSDWTTHLAPD